MRLDSHSIGHAIGTITAKFLVTNDVVDAIKNGENITIRITFNDEINDTIDISEDIKNEWKQVIATER